MKVFLTSAYTFPSPDYGPSWLLSHARSGRDDMADNPDAADAIVFVERYQADDPFYQRVTRSPHFKNSPQRCLLYHPADHALPFCRTITPSNDRRLWGRRSRRSFHYIARFCENDGINQASPAEWNPKFLYSFQGSSSTHLVRRQLFHEKHPHGMMIDNGGLSHHLLTTRERAEFEQRYVDVIQASQFVLCPRGFGPCSYRLFETMKLGRVPVIVSDDWIPVPHVPWQQCSLTVREKDVVAIPDLLNESRKDAQEMGMMARQVWEQHFSPEVSLERIIEEATELIRSPYGLGERLAESRNLLYQPFIRMFASSLRRHVLGKFDGGAGLPAQ